LEFLRKSALANRLLAVQAHGLGNGMSMVWVAAAGVAPVAAKMIFAGTSARRGKLRVACGERAL